MKIFMQFLIVAAVLFAGEFLNKLFNLPIPGNVIGMIVLFLLLVLGIVKVEMLEDMTSFLLDNLAFFFIPIGVGLLASFHILKGQILGIIIVITISTAIVLGVTAKTIQFMRRGRF